MKTNSFLTTIILLCIIMLNVNELKAQQVLNGVYVKEHIMGKKPIPYQYLREADVMWSKTIWRVIELKEKMNHPLYYPEDPIGKYRMSLIDVLMRGIDIYGIKAFKGSTYDEFTTEMNMDDIEAQFGVGIDTNITPNFENPNIMDTIIVKNELTTSDVKQYIVKEVWFFDKQRSVLEVRILGLCPVKVTKKGKKKLFWVYFPEARKILANYEVFNTFTDAERRSYDDIFFKRLFSSHIVQESNAYNDRMIDEYTTGLETLLEAERIKEKIFNFEQDLWEY